MDWQTKLQLERDRIATTALVTYIQYWAVEDADLVLMYYGNTEKGSPMFGLRYEVHGYKGDLPKANTKEGAALKALKFLRDKQPKTHDIKTPILNI